MYTPTHVRMSTFDCGAGKATAKAVWAVFVPLVLLHLLLLMAPIVSIIEIVKRLPPTPAPASGTRADHDGPLKHPGVLLAAMAVFCVACLGEIALHVQQNWVYLGLMPSWYNVTFYGALTLGEVRWAPCRRGWVPAVHAPASVA